MTIDKEKLKALAERAVAGNPPGGDGNPFPALAVRAVDILALLAEIERLESEAMHAAAGAQSDREQRDQLKAENEALRKDAERYRWLKRQRSKAWRDAAGVPMNHTDAFIDAAMVKEAER